MRTQIQLYREGRPSTPEEVWEAMRREDEREKEALRKFYERQHSRSGVRLTVWGLTKFLGQVVLVSVAIWARLVLALTASL